jgi:hypothetical protein
MFASRRERTIAALLLSIAAVVPFATLAAAQAVLPPTNGAPPPDASALVAAPTAPKALVVDKTPTGTTLTVSAGGQQMTGNSRLLAVTGNAVYARRWTDDAFGASIIGNYGQGAPPGAAIVETTENAQGRLRYDRYVLKHMSVFLITTGRHDRFQGLDFRLNIDPGVKYLFLDEKTTSLWGELGYDFQYDIRRDDSLGVLDATGAPVIDPATGLQEQLSKTATDHSGRLFVGFRHAFNESVILSWGIEYLQSLLASTEHDARLNYDALFSAKVSKSLSLGFGISARYDAHPLPGKVDMDTSTTVSLIYAFTNYGEPPKPPPPVCAPPPLPPPPLPPPPPEAAPPPPPPPGGT